MTELKPCPFCGGTKLFVGHDYEIDPSEGSEWIDNFGVVCDLSKGGCGATSGYRETKKEAIEAWNRRIEK